MKRYVTGCKRFRDPVLETEYNRFASQSDNGAFHLRGADQGRRPMTAAAHGCTFPLRRIRSGTVADPPWLVINIYLQLISISDRAVVVTDFGVMLLWSSADNGI